MMMYIVQVEQKALRARSDPMDAPTALKVAKAWQSHGDRGVQILESAKGAPESLAGARSWAIREFIVFLKQPLAPRFDTPGAADQPGEDDLRQVYATRS